MDNVKPLYRGTRLVWYILGLLEALLAFRFSLKLFGANPSAGFSDFIYTLSAPFVSPFVNVFGTGQVDRSIFEWTTLLAMLVYWFLAWGIVKLIAMSRPVSRDEAHDQLRQEDHQ